MKLVGLLSIHAEHIIRALPSSMALEASISFLMFQDILAPVIAHEPAEHPATGVLASFAVLILLRFVLMNLPLDCEA
jgi:hypothetical protein